MRAPTNHRRSTRRYGSATQGPPILRRPMQYWGKPGLSSKRPLSTDLSNRFSRLSPRRGLRPAVANQNDRSTEQPCRCRARTTEDRHRTVVGAFRLRHPPHRIHPVGMMAVGYWIKRFPMGLSLPKTWARARLCSALLISPVVAMARRWTTNPVQAPRSARPLTTKIFEGCGPLGAEVVEGTGFEPV